MSTASEGTPTPNSGGKSQTPASTGTLALLTASALGSLIGSRLGPVPLALAAGATALALMNRKKQAETGTTPEPAVSAPPAGTFPASGPAAIPSPPPARLPRAAAAAASSPFPPAPPAQPPGPAAVDPLIQKWLASQLEREKLADEAASSLSEPLPPAPLQEQGLKPALRAAPEVDAPPPTAVEPSPETPSELEDTEYQPEPLLEDPVAEAPPPSPWKSPSFAQLTEPTPSTASPPPAQSLLEKPAQPWPPSSYRSTGSAPEPSKALPSSLLPDPPPWAAWFKDNAHPPPTSITPPPPAAEPPATAPPPSLQPSQTPASAPAVKNSSWAEIAAAAGLVQTPAVPLFKTLPTEPPTLAPAPPPPPAVPASTPPAHTTREAPEPFRSAFHSGSGKPAPAPSQAPIADIEPLPSWTEPKPSPSAGGPSSQQPSSAAAPEPFRALPPMAARPAPLSTAAASTAADPGFNLESLFSAPPATPPSALAASSTAPAIPAPVGPDSPPPIKTAPTGPLGPIAEANAPFFSAGIGAGPTSPPHSLAPSQAEVPAPKAAPEPPPAVEDPMAAFFRTPAVPTSPSVSEVEKAAAPPTHEPTDSPARDIDVHVAAPGEAWFDSPLATLPHNPWLAPKAAADEAPLASSMPPPGTSLPAPAPGVQPIQDAEMVLRPRAPVQSSVKPRSLHPTPAPKGTPPLPDDKTPGSTAPLQLPPEPPREERPRNSTWRSWWRGD